jgi:hypothetical protein
MNGILKIAINKNYFNFIIFGTFPLSNLYNVRKMMKISKADLLLAESIAGMTINIFKSYTVPRHSIK